MMFARPWVLALASLPLAWMAFEWWRTSRHLALTLKALSLVAILTALAEPRWSVSKTNIALAVLVDTSASIPPSDLQRASRITSAIAGEQGRHWMRVLPFARSTRTLGPNEEPESGKLQPATGETGRATDLEAAVRDAIASLPSGMVPRVALISDGKENKGSVARAAWQAQQLQIPIDTFALAGRARPTLRLESIQLPSFAFTGEQFPIGLNVFAPKDGPAEVELSAEGRTLGHSQVPLKEGTNSILLHASLNAPGALDLSISLRLPGAGEVHFEQVVTLRRPKVLYITQDPPALDSHLTSTLTAAQFEIERVADFTQSNLSDYQLLIFDNWDLESIPAARKQDVEKYVREGGGLLVIGGDRNNYPDGKTAENVLERALPAKLAPPRSPEVTAVVLAIDKSSSMLGRKIDLAKRAAIGVAGNLRPTDLVGILIFDSSWAWTVPIRPAEDRDLIRRMISGIQAEGGTEIAPALSEAFRSIQLANASLKHIVLLTDGVSEEGNSMDLTREAQSKQVTISTVGLGQDVNRPYLEKIAQSGGGNSYFLLEPAGLEQILLRDVREHTGTTAMEKPHVPKVTRRTEILDGVEMETAPALKGYARFEAKPSAETILTIDTADPLLSRWQYGLGRSAVFASDAKARWAADWVAWKGYDKFWTNLCRDLLPRAQAGEATIEFDDANGDLVVNYRLSGAAQEPAAIPEIFVFGPDGFERPIAIKKIAAGSFRGRLQIGAREGLFRVRPLVESRAFPEAGLYRPEAELADYGSNATLLRQIAEFTGGRFEPDPKDVFDAGGRSIASAMQLWPGLLALAIILNLIELVMRKWRGIGGS